MIAKIDQITTDKHGNLAAHVVFSEGGQQVNAQQFAFNAPVSRLVPYRNADGLLERLDGVAVPASPAAEERLLADQVGIKQLVLATPPADIAAFVQQQITAWASVHRRAVALQQQAETATDEQLLAMASGRATHWSQVHEVAAANGETAEADKAAQRLALALSAASNAAIARQLALAEIAPQLAVLTPEPLWPAGGIDPRGYLQMAEVTALLNAEWEV